MKKQRKQVPTLSAKKADPKDDEVIEAIMRVSMYVQSELGAAMQQLGLSPANCEVLAALSAHPDGILSTDLAGKLHCTKANISQLVTRMEKSGLLSRVASKEDKRASMLKLTAHGNSQSAAALQVRLQTEKRILKNFSDEEKKVFANLMTPDLGS